MNEKDSAGYYKILRLKRNAGAEEIKQSYRELAKKWHPDYNKSEEAMEIFQKISVAHEILSDKNKRITYDLACIAYDEKEFPDIFSLKIHKNKKGEEDVSIRSLKIEEQRGRLWGAKKTAKKIICSYKEAEREFFWSSVKNWLLGWWTLRDFINNARIIGKNYKNVEGYREENLKLFVHNALAYGQEKKYDFAMSCAKQAKQYATEEEKKLLDEYIRQLPPTTEKKIAEWNDKRLRMIQLIFPLLMFLLVVGITISKHSALFEGYYLMQGDEIDYYQQVRMQGGSSVDDMVVGKIININSDISSRKMLYHVKEGYTADVMYGPSDDFDKIMIIANKATVRITGISPDNVWYRIMLDNGDMGFVRTEFLKKGIGADIPTDSKIFERK